jgi:sulfane dehydrogenase subunit SoxC
LGSHHHSDRRQFLTESAALASLAVGAVQSASAQTPQPEARLKDTLAYGQPSRFDSTVRKALGAGSAIADTALTTPLQDLDGIITPSGLHFLMDHVNGIPEIDPRQHHLLMHGMVDRPLTFTMDELRRFPSVSKSISSNATPTAARFVARTVIPSSSYTGERAAASGPECCCRSC